MGADNEMVEAYNANRSDGLCCDVGDWLETWGKFEIIIKALFNLRLNQF